MVQDLTLSQVKVIFFDLDNTLWDHTKNQALALAKVHAQLNLPVKFSLFHEIYHRENEKAWAKYREGTFTSEDVKIQRFINTFKCAGIDAPELAEKAAKLYHALYPQQTVLCAGAHETLSILKEHYVLGLITNGFHDSQEMKLRNLGLKDYFSYFVYSEDIHIAKPNPGIFRHAQGLAGTEPRENVYIGDDLENDIQAAQAVGWQTIYYRPHEDLLNDRAPETQPAYTVRSLREIPPLFYLGENPRQYSKP